MFSMTVQGESLADLKANLLASAAAMQGGNDATPATRSKPSSGSADDAPTSSQGKKGSSQSATESSSSAGRAGKASSTEDDDDAPSLSYETDVRPLIIKLAKDHGREASAELCGHFQNEDGDDCTKGQEVQEKDWPELVKKAKAMQKRMDKAKAEAAADE